MAKINFGALVFCSQFVLSYEAFAQGTGLLPKGVGLYQFSYRAMSGLDTKFNESNSLVRLGHNFDRDFNGPEMMTGRLGKDMKKLATTLSEFEGRPAEPGTLAGDLVLGQMRGEVVANVNTAILRLGFGVHRSVTLFAGLPYISAKVDTKLSLSGRNNAQATLDRLGGAAFDELRDGLERAAKLSTDDIKETFLENGYEPVDSWSHTGVGDLRIGAKTGFSTLMPDGDTLYSASTSFRLEIPTGYSESPHVLTDINFGRGYYAIGLGFDQNLSLPHFFVGSDGGYVFNFNTKLEKRVPEDTETTMPRERTATVSLDPGDESEVGGYLGATYGWFTSRYRLGFARHFADKYSGDLVGNYQQLSKDSDSWRLNHEVVLSLDTSKAFREGKFKIPFIMALKGFVVGKGLNSSEQKYIELSLSSFFSTPWATTEPKSGSGKKLKSR